MNALSKQTKDNFVHSETIKTILKKKKKCTKLEMNLIFSNFFVIRNLVNFQNCIKTSINQYKSLVLYFQILILSKNITKYSTKES